MFNKPFDKITKEDIKNLVTDKIQEMRRLDYKQKLPAFKAPKDTIEFLADVSSFANASGGYIIYGIKEKRDSKGRATGKPEKIIGLPGVSTDSEIRRLEQKIRSGIDPKVPIEIKAIDDFSEGPLLLMRIPQSWASPHMVKCENVSRFYSRSSNGKHRLDVQEIRAAFALSEALPERMKRFRDDRVAKIIADETPVPLKSGSRVALHVMPISSFDSKTQIDLSEIKTHFANLCPLIYGKATHYRFNFDGFLVTSLYENPANFGYTQLFRNGTIETVSVSLAAGKTINSWEIEEGIINSLDKYLVVLREKEIMTPIIIMLSLLGVKGYELDVDPMRYRQPNKAPFDKDYLFFPEVILEVYDSDIKDIMRPTIDIVWQAAGWER